MTSNLPSLETVTSFAKRRGFVYPSSEIYGGLANSWDFGHYGTLLKNNLRDLWWKHYVTSRKDMVGIDASVFLNPIVWEASGHVANFADVMVEDTKNHKRYRADHLIEEYFHKKNQEVKADGKSPEELGKIIQDNNIKSPDGNTLGEPRRFNQLFSTEIGIIVGEKKTAYLRGEIAQGIFLNFKNVINTMRVKIPFGIAQQGKAFRNEITPGQFIHRTSEFDLMEFEYFIDPNANWQEIFEYWKKDMWDFATEFVGISPDNLRWREHEEFERSHYSLKTVDLEYKYPYGFKEMWGLAYRTDFDLKNHSQKSGQDLSYKNQSTGYSFLPHVIEPTFGLSRLVGICLFDAYQEENLSNDKTRVVLKIKPSLAPIKAAVFPLQRDPKLGELAQQIYTDLTKELMVEYDDSGNIGKMYRRQDEIGTPFCLVVDYQSLEDNTLTIRERDTMTQVRIPISEAKSYLFKHLLI